MLGTLGDLIQEVATGILAMRTKNLDGEGNEIFTEDHPGMMKQTGSIELGKNTDFTLLSGETTMELFNGTFPEGATGVIIATGTSSLRDFKIHVSQCPTGGYSSTRKYDKEEVFENVRHNLYMSVNKVMENVKIELENLSENQTYVSPQVNFIYTSDWNEVVIADDEIISVTKSVKSAVEQSLSDVNLARVDYYDEVLDKKQILIDQRNYRLAYEEGNPLYDWTHITSIKNLGPSPVGLKLFGYTGRIRTLEINETITINHPNDEFTKSGDELWARLGDQDIFTMLEVKGVENG